MSARQAGLLIIVVGVAAALLGALADSAGYRSQRLRVEAGCPARGGDRARRRRGGGGAPRAELGRRAGPRPRAGSRRRPAQTSSPPDRLTDARGSPAALWSAASSDPGVQLLGSLRLSLWLCAVWAIVLYVFFVTLATISPAKVAGLTVVMAILAAAGDDPQPPPGERARRPRRRSPDQKGAQQAARAAGLLVRPMGAMARERRDPGRHPGPAHRGRSLVTSGGRLRGRAGLADRPRGVQRPATLRLSGDRGLPAGLERSRPLRRAPAAEPVRGAHRGLAWRVPG